MNGADLLVGADGLNSLARRSIVDARPRYAGYTTWRGVSPQAIAPGRLTESWGAGERFGLVDIGHGWTYWFATKNAPAGEVEEPARPEGGDHVALLTERVLKLSRRADRAAQLASPLACRLRNAAVRHMPERAQRRQLEPLVRRQA